MQLMLPQISQPLTLWEKIQIIAGDGDDRGLYLARIEGFIGGGIIINTPEYIEGKTLLRDNSRVLVLFTKEDAVYQFYSRIKKLNVPRKNHYILSPPRHVKRVQRRQFVRIELFSKISYANIGTSYCDQEIKWQDSVCLNLSGGGMLIKGTEGLNLSDIILIKANLFHKLGLSQLIVGVCQRIFYEEKQRCGGIEFIISDRIANHFSTDQLKALPPGITEFDSTAQNKLINYIFQQQIEMRQKGLI